MEKTYYQAPTAAVLGDVELGDGVSVWFSSVVRGDESRIKIGNQTNIQENCTVHVEEGHPVLVGERVTVGHNTILHGCTIGDETMIGMGSIIMNGAQIGTHCFIGAGKQQVLCGNCTKSSYREKFIIYTKSSYREKFII